MKNLEKDQLKSLLDIIGSNPSHQIVHFADSGETLTEMLSAYCQQREYLYQINCTEKKFYEKMSEKFKDVETTTVFNFPLQRRSYMVQAREYNFLFLTANIDEDTRGDFLKKAHKIIRSAGSIIIFLPKNDYALRDAWLADLEEHSYVSTSTVDDLFENYDLLISRKMHGWGN